MTPRKTIERLIVYKGIIEKLLAKGTTHVFSRDIAKFSANTAEQVRRDLMFVGYSGTPQKGYCLDILLKKINELFVTGSGISIVLVGAGNLGRALLGYFSVFQPEYIIKGVFDVDENKINKKINGYYCYHTDDLVSVINGKSVQVGVITVPGKHAQDVADRLINAGIKGIVNFAPVPIKVPSTVYIENIQIEVIVEKVAYFARN